MVIRYPHDPNMSGVPDAHRGDIGSNEVFAQLRRVRKGDVICEVHRFHKRFYAMDILRPSGGGSCGESGSLPTATMVRNQEDFESALAEDSAIQRTTVLACYGLVDTAVGGESISAEDEDNEATWTDSGAASKSEPSLVYTRKATEIRNGISTQPAEDPPASRPTVTTG